MKAKVLLIIIAIVIALSGCTKDDDGLYDKEPVNPDRVNPCLFKNDC